MRVHALVIPTGILLLALLTTVVGTGTLLRAEIHRRADPPAERAFLDRMDAGPQERIRPIDAPSSRERMTAGAVRAERRPASREAPAAGIDVRAERKAAVRDLLDDVLARSGYAVTEGAIDPEEVARAVHRRAGPERSVLRLPREDREAGYDPNRFGGYVGSITEVP